MASKVGASNVLILSHFYKRANAAGGPPQELRDFLLDKTAVLVYIEHPFPYADDHRSSMTIYRVKAKPIVIFGPTLAGPQAFFYLADIFLTWYFLMQARQSYALCVALDNLNTLSVWPWRFFGKIKKLVFYTIDYTPRRFSQPLLNAFYRLGDRLACIVADKIWVLSERMIAAREAAGLSSSQKRKSIVVPMGAKLARIRPLAITQIRRSQLIFVGHLLEKQGLQLVIRALPTIAKRVPGVHLVVIGQGEYTATLTDLAKTLAVSQYIEWCGFIEKHEAVEERLCQSAIGLAPYIPSDTNYTYFTDPGKPKLYLACGLPVVMTDFPASAQLIAKAKAGLIVLPNADSTAKAILKLLTNDSTYAAYRRHAMTLAKDFDTDTILTRAFHETPFRIDHLS